MLPITLLPHITRATSAYGGICVGLSWYLFMIAVVIAFLAKVSQTQFSCCMRLS
jgi:hypothetical protein